MNNLISLDGIPMSSILRKCAKNCGSAVEYSLVLFSIFGLFFTFNHLFFVGGRLVKNVALWTECDDGESRFFIGTVCVCSSHDSLLLSGGICLDVI